VSDRRQVREITQEEAQGLLQWLHVILDQTDYTTRMCSPTDMVAAVLETGIIEGARAAIAKAEGKA
jgi:hypothetical protein